jgi:cytochrome c peroxidase
VPEKERHVVYRRPATILAILAAVAAVLGKGHAADTELRTQALSVFRPLAVDGSSAADPVAARRVALGRLLYFEPRVSADGTVSCARCHQPTLYGTDGLPRSIGAEHRVHPRHASTVLNAALQFVQHWRGDRTSVEDQAMQALIGPPSYGNPSYESAIAKIKAIPAYTTLFAEAFPGQGDSVTPRNWGQAIGAYVRTLLTPALFDRFLAGDDVAMSPSARSGLRTFMRVGCATCHNGSGVGGTMYQKFGLKKEYWTATGSRAIDKGRFEVTKDPADMYVFKVPMLRNVAMTAPYFHDGSVATLPDAVRIMGRVQLGLTLSQREAGDLVAFLESLTGPLPDNFTTVPTLPISAPR